MVEAVWRVHPADSARAHALAEALDIHPLTAQLLLNRGIHDATTARRFLQPDLGSLSDPLTLPDMASAIARIRQAITRHEPILIFGDSDVDGLTASAILYEALRELGGVVRAKQSNRIAEGYGLPMTVVRDLCRSSVRLVILVDCGTNQSEAVQRLAAHGIDTIVVDHHVASEQPAAPHALINPHVGDGTMGRELCSAGLAFKMAQALFGPQGIERLAAYLDLAALGTLADCSPLRGDSRAIVSAGLEWIVESRRPGLRRLCEATKTRRPNPEEIVRRLVPRLNASGRLGDAAMAWRLLLADGAEELEDWMAAVEAAHATTKQLHRRIMGEAQEQVNRLHFRDHYVVVVSQSGWPPGLMGPLASQLAERYRRPTIAIALAQHYGVGSGRSVPMFNLLNALKRCQAFLVQFGGHAQACGLTIDRRHLEQVRAALNHDARETLGPEGLVRTEVMDLDLPLSAIEPRWVAEGERLAPFGRGNARPTVVVRRVGLERHSPRIGWVTDGQRRVMGRGVFPSERSGGRYDVAVRPALEEGKLVLMVTGVKGSMGPGGPVPISSKPCTPGSASPCR